MRDAGTVARETGEIGAWGAGAEAGDADAVEVGRGADVEETGDGAGVGAWETAAKWNIERGAFVGAGAMARGMGMRGKTPTNRSSNPHNASPFILSNFAI